MSAWAQQLSNSRQALGWTWVMALTAVIAGAALALLPPVMIALALAVPGPLPFSLRD